MWWRICWLLSTPPHNSLSKNMTIIEQSIIGKQGAEHCEDGLVVNDAFVAVVDGSTSKSRQQYCAEMSNGQYCMSKVVEYILSMATDSSCQEFCQGITSFIRSFYGESEADMEQLRRHPTERMAASAAVYSIKRQEIWLVGDCQCMVDGRLYDNPKPYEELIAEMRGAYIRQQLRKGRPLSSFQVHDDGREYILPVLTTSCRYQNVTYPVIDGFPIPFEKVRVTDVSGATEIVLASDGYPVLYPTLSESEQALARQLSEDPLCICRFKATKGLMRGNLSFDDRTYIRFRP